MHTRGLPEGDHLTMQPFLFPKLAYYFEPAANLFYLGKRGEVVT